LHFAVAPAGSVLPAALVGAEVEAEADFAAVVAAGAVCDIAPEGAGVAAGAVVVADVLPVVADLVAVAFWTPPWPLQAPLPVAVEAVPSLHVVPPVLAVEAAGAAAGGAAVIAMVELGAAAFCTPPWPLQAPLPVADEVVPSLQVVGVVASAWLGSVITNISNGAAKALTRCIFFTDLLPCLVRVALEL
jgi:hypothetical protein